MAGRIRTLKPELLEDEKTASLPDDAFRLFVSLILLSDDYGNVRATPSWLRGQVWWNDDEPRDIPKMLQRLSGKPPEGLGKPLIELYEVNGQSYLHLSGWDKHQRVSHPGKPRVPRPEDGLPIPSGDSPETLVPDLRSPTSDLRSPTTEGEPARDSINKEQNESLSPQSQATMDAILLHLPQSSMDTIWVRQFAVKMTRQHPNVNGPAVVKEFAEGDALNPKPTPLNNLGLKLGKWFKTAAEGTKKPLQSFGRFPQSQPTPPSRTPEEVAAAEEKARVAREAEDAAARDAEAELRVWLANQTMEERIARIAEQLHLPPTHSKVVFAAESERCEYERYKYIEAGK